LIKGTRAREFVEHVGEVLDKDGVDLVLVNDTSVEITKDMLCSGYFDEENKVIKVAIKRETYQWIGVLAHEFCHYTQWKEQCDAWTNALINGNDVNYYIERWISGEDVHCDRIMHLYCYRCQQLELDNEIRSIDMIRKFNLPVPIRHYTRAAAAYIHFHNVMAEERKWFKDGYKLSEDDVLLNMIPATMKQDFIHTPDRIKDYMVHNCI
jgi:hypothetical protein